ncbi:MAG: hypothetical protein ACU836_14685 [Gammaproteobacteria bacterium]
MNWIAKWIKLLLFVFPVLLGICLILSFEDQPLLKERADLTPEQIARGKRIFDRNDPRQLRSGVITQARLPEQDLDLAINYAANQMFNGVAGVAIEEGRAVGEATIKLPNSMLGQYLNLKLVLRQDASLPSIDYAKIGKLWLPGFLAEWLLGEFANAASSTVDWQALLSMVKRVKFHHGQMVVTYQWRQDLPGKLSSALLPSAEQERISVYQTRLTELVKNKVGRIDLADLTKNMFQIAKERSQGADAISENRALILVLAFYVNQRDLAKLFPTAHQWAKPRWRPVMLAGRQDFTKHYLVSAMLAAYAGTPLADAVGVFKEIEDSRGGSGFSFNDIAADRAGRRFGELAVSSRSRAEWVQRFFATADEADFMPATVDLPEFMPENVFKRHYGGLEGEKYRQMIAKIDRRIAALPISGE